MNAFPTLGTDRLLLREIVMSDASTLLDMHGDAEAMKWFGVDPITELSQAQALVDTFSAWRIQPNPGTRWGIQLKGHEALIGNCGLFKWNRGWKSCSVGFALARSSWGKGVMHEALQGMLAWGFEQMQLNRVEAAVQPENEACLKLLTRLGFEQEGRLREAGYWLGEHRDLLQLSLLRAEFKSTPSSTR